jgi:hypothetical protein
VLPRGAKARLAIFFRHVSAGKSAIRNRQCAIVSAFTAELLAVIGVISDFGLALLPVPRPVAAPGNPAVCRSNLGQLRLCLAHENEDRLSQTSREVSLDQQTSRLPGSWEMPSTIAQSRIFSLACSSLYASTGYIAAHPTNPYVLVPHQLASDASCSLSGWFRQHLEGKGWFVTGQSEPSWYTTSGEIQPHARRDVRSSMSMNIASTTAYSPPLSLN